MSDSIQKTVGIDLGTTYSCIAHVDEHGKPVVLPNFDSNRITPSVVYFESDASIIVGEEAKANMKIAAEHTVAFVKRDMGNEHFLFEYEGVSYRPEEISSFILKKVIQDAQSYLGEDITDVVITCPAYFGVNEREATRKAGEIAGLNVRSIINEPTAAAIAYGMAQEEEKVILVYDLGGGTFDITMIEVKAEAIKVIVTGGDHNLGGKNWDDSIVSFLADSFQQETGTEDILDDVETLNALMLAAENAKKSLTQRPKTTVLVQHEGEKAKVELTREKLEEITAPLLERTVALTHDMLQEAEKKGYTQFDELILVGGSCKMPMIADRLQRDFSQEPKLMDPDEAVAKGAALYGYKMAINDELVRRIADQQGGTEEEVSLDTVDAQTLDDVAKEVAQDHGLRLGAVQQATQQKIINVTSKSFGVVAVDSGSDEEKLFNLILRNDEVPITRQQQFATYEDHQATARLRIMASEVSVQTLDPADGLEIGDATLKIPDNMPAGHPIEVTYTISEQGTLKVTAVELKDRLSVEVTLETNSIISEEEEAAAKARSQQIVIS